MNVLITQKIRIQRLIISASILILIFFNLSVVAQNATNPILYTDVPDPDFVRVGDTYYMSSTTMYFNPGLPIMKSTDLVNWELVNYCYPIMASNDNLNLANGKEAYSGGTWASSINYHNNRFYVSSFSYTTGKTYIYHTADIENGPWTTITLNKVYHDHSILFDNNRVFIAYGHDNIQLTELRPDLTGEQPGGINKVIINKASSVAGSSFILTAEGTRIQKINGMYYVSNICWPSGKGRTQILHRSNTIDGNYEGRVVFQSSTGSAQGEYIDTPDGKWYAMFFHDHGALGRIPDLMPVTWNAGWPTVGVNGQVPATINIPKGAGNLKGLIDSDEFNTAAPLKLQWQWNHNPQNNYWSLSQKPGFLRLTNERTDANVLKTTNTLTQRSFGPKSSGYVALDVSGMKNGDYAGLVALQNNYGWIGVKMSGGNKTIVRAQGKGFNANHTELASVPINQNTVYLRLDFDFTNRVDDVYFFYSLNGTSWTAFGSKTDLNFDLEHFTGYRFGLFSYATQSSGGYVDFDYFRVGANITEAMSVGSTVAFTSPKSSTDSFEEGDNIVLTATAIVPNGTVSNIKFYNGTILLSTSTTAPYTYTITNAVVGKYNFRAVLTDSQGKTAEATLTIRVNVPQAPYGGTAHPIPGTIQLEEYDVGGNGSAYMDDTPGSETDVTFRDDEDVDLENCTDAGAGYNLGWTSAGEWVEYTVDVTKPGRYSLDIRSAVNGTDRTVSVTMDGEAIATDVAIPNTTGWQVWQTVTVDEIVLMPGEKVMRLTIGATDYVNLNYVTFTLEEEFVQEPFNSTAHQIPGKIEAEEYDLGGEGLAYHEANMNGNQGTGTFRDDEVDIEVCTDAGGGFNLGYTLTGEWLEYTVNVANTGNYDLDLRLAKDGDGGLFHIEMDDVDITGPIEVPNTGGWQVWETVKLEDLSLTAGEHIMKIVFDTDYTNLNYIEFKGLVTHVSFLGEDNVFLYPNPTQGVFNLSRNSHSDGEVEPINITDVTGKQIQPLNIYYSSSHITIDLSGHNDGIYFVQMDGNNYRVMITK